LSVEKKEKKMAKNSAEMMVVMKAVLTAAALGL